jgi:hypothetical protein
VIARSTKAGSECINGAPFRTDYRRDRLDATAGMVP